jgi:peptidoglycan/LPS O-acetylase OafA/YrhL
MTTTTLEYDAPSAAAPAELLALAEASSSAPVVAESIPTHHKHIPALDAIRGLAILMVTAFRFFPAYDDPSLAGRLCTRAFEFGGRGVDLFFVLSGFLITGILYDAKHELHYFRNFYARRSLRIFPLYYAALLLMLVLLPAVGLCKSAEFAKGEAYSTWLWLYGTNIVLAWQGSWCLGAYNHFWSLAVEEHFYLVWPLVIFFCSRKTAIWVCLASIVLGIIGRAVWLHMGGSDVGVQVLTPLRVDSLALGALIALVARGTSDLKSWRPWAIACCVLVVVAMLPPLNVHKRVPPLRETMYALFFGGLIVLAVTARASGWWARMWNLPSLRFFGKYSYGMYVIQNFLKAALPPEMVIAAIAAGVGSIFWSRCAYLGIMSIVTVIGALLSWNLLEKHFLRFKSRFEDKQPREKSAGSVARDLPLRQALATSAE